MSLHCMSLPIQTYETGLSGRMTAIMTHQAFLEFAQFLVPHLWNKKHCALSIFSIPDFTATFTCRDSMELFADGISQGKDNEFRHTRQCQSYCSGSDGPCQSRNTRFLQHWTGNQLKLEMQRTREYWMEFTGF